MFFALPGKTELARAAVRAAVAGWRWTSSTPKKLPNILPMRRRGRRLCSSMRARRRRARWEHIPMPRMTNTYMLAGTDAPEDIIRSVKRGVFAANFGGGQVDITSGKFVFSASEAYLIEDGQITAPLRNATLIGNGPDALTKVSMVGNDLQLDEGIGTCGKEGQSVPVGVGIPTIKVDRMTVGGTGG